MSLEIINIHENQLLGRKEVDCVFKSSAGFITRIDAVKSIAKKLNVDPSMVHTVSLRCSSGIRDVEGTLYVYYDDGLAKKQLPPHQFTRGLGKEDRKKANQ